jgi:hypothetical protein
MLTPSFAANASWEMLAFIGYFVSNSASDWVLFWKGCESTLTALINKWQKGCRNHPLRHILLSIESFWPKRGVKFVIVNL